MDVAVSESVSGVLSCEGCEPYPAVSLSVVEAWMNDCVSVSANEVEGDRAAYPQIRSGCGCWR